MLDVKEIIKDTLSIQEVYERLGLSGLKRSGETLRGNCITGHLSKSGTCFQIHLTKNFFNCFSCGIGGDIIKLVEIVRSVDFKSALRWVLEQFRPDLLGELEKSSDKSLEREYYQKAALYDLVFEYGKKLLYEPQGKDVLEYLTDGRGYQVEHIKQTEWIYFPTDREIRDYLLSVQPEAKEDIEGLSLQGHYGDNFRLAFPYRDRRGVITGFIKRATKAEGITVKDESGVRYDSTKGLKKHDLFGLYACRGQDTLIIVEGCPDVLYLPVLLKEKNIKNNIVAVSQGRLSKSHIEGLKSFGIKRVILSFDNDKPKENGKIEGIENTEKALILLNDSGIQEDIQAFVIDPPLLAPYKDPDELTQSKEIDAFLKLAANPISGSRWQAKRILGKYDLSTDIGQRKALEELLDFASLLKDPLDIKAFIEEVTQKLCISPILLSEKIGDYQERKARARLEKGYKELLKEGERKLQQGEIMELGTYIQTASQALKVDYEQNRAQPSKSYAERLRDQYEQETKRKPGLLGYNLSIFSKLAYYIDGIQPGLYIIGAETNIGKTAFLTNLFMDILLTNQNVICLYFSLDDSTLVIHRRFVSILTHFDLNKIQRRQETEQEQRTVNQAYHTLIKYAESGRITVKDLSEIHHIDTLELDIREKARDNKIFVAIDGLYNLAVGKAGNIREENIERANRVKTLVDTYNIPIATTAEIRKKAQGQREDKEPTIHDLMETGKFGYNANVVWLLYPEGQEKAKKDDDIDLILNYEKNKLSWFKGNQKLRFYRRQGRLEEIREESEV